MELLKWDESLETGIPAVDKQHHHLVDVTNKFGSALLQGEVSPEVVETLLEELVSYAKYHFDEEEKIMRTSGVDSRHCGQDK